MQILSCVFLCCLFCSIIFFIPFLRFSCNLFLLGASFFSFFALLVQFSGFIVKFFFNSPNTQMIFNGCLSYKHIQCCSINSISFLFLFLIWFLFFFYALSSTEIQGPMKLCDFPEFVVLISCDAKYFVI